MKYVCCAIDTAVQVDICVYYHPCAAPGCLTDYPRDRCCRRSTRSLRPEAHQQDIHIFRSRSLNVNQFPIYHRPSCLLIKPRTGNSCIPLHTAVHVIVCVGGNPGAAPGLVLDYPRDRCCCRTPHRCRPVTHQRDIIIFRSRSSTV